ncbi:MAG: dihydrofolate reductase family protein [Bacteroidetes bacterium]|nr:dihydrofolate reductase family protein [Bacteroidota bacterium]MCB0844175.1 dihydrofolate reductase family protein [Bacteroidota bacterium]
MPRKIIYYVAASIDGFISGPGDDISGFVADGNGVEKYLADLQEFDTVIMGRKTYEFGYKYGLKPGQPAYPHMEHYIFSRTLKLENAHEKIHIHPPDLDLIQNLKSAEGTPVYLCGGGVLAGWLLENELIDILKIKLNPFIQGEGVRIFGDSKKTYQLQLLEKETFENGLQIISYKILY